MHIFIPKLKGCSRVTNAVNHLHLKASLFSTDLSTAKLSILPAPTVKGGSFDQLIMTHMKGVTRAR